VRPLTESVASWCHGPPNWALVEEEGAHGAHAFAPALCDDVSEPCGEGADLGQGKKVARAVQVIATRQVVRQHLA
jgi:hypothetical protein